MMDRARDEGRMGMGAALGVVLVARAIGESRARINNCTLSLRANSASLHAHGQLM